MKQIKVLNKDKTKKAERPTKKQKLMVARVKACLAKLLKTGDPHGYHTKDSLYNYVCLSHNV